jgi:ATP-binding cassette, subfamily C, bacterial PrsD
MLLAFLALGVFSFLINILGLTGSFFMLQVYDRVVPSHSVPTLVALALLAILLYSFLRIPRYHAGKGSDPYQQHC